MAKLKAKKETKGKSGIGSFPWFVWLAIALVLAGIVAFVRIYPVNEPSSDNLAESKAAIVDQLHSLQPNEAFISEATREFEDMVLKLIFTRVMRLPLTSMADCQAMGIS